MSGSSNFTLTPNVSLYKPTFNSDVDAWGGHWNANADTLDNLLKATGTGTTFLPVAGGAMTGPLNYTATGTTTSRSAQDRAADWINVEDYGARLDGTTSTAGLQAARNVLSGTQGRLFVGPGTIASGAVAAPAGSAAIWEMQASQTGGVFNVYNENFGTDIVHTTNQGEWWYQRNTSTAAFSNNAPLLRIDRRITHVGGSGWAELELRDTWADGCNPGNQMTTLNIITTAASTTATGQPAVGMYVNANRTAGITPLYGAVVSVTDRTGAASGVALIAMEVDCSGNGTWTNYQAGGIDIVTNKPTPGGLAAHVNFGVRVSNNAGDLTKGGWDIPFMLGPANAYIAAFGGLGNIATGAVAFDASQMTYTDATKVAVRLGVGNVLDLSSNAGNYLQYTTSGTPRLRYMAGATEVWSASDAGALTFNGTTSHVGTATFTTRAFLQGSASTGTTVGNSDVSINGAATGTRALNIQAASATRWQIAGVNTGLAGANQDTDLTIGSYLDGGTFNTFFMKIKRGTGPLNIGPPTAYDAGPIWLTKTGAVTAGGTVGHRILIDDQQPVYPLAANPISTVSGSPTVTVALANAGAMLATNPASWVNLLGATAVGGITPTGWLKVQSIAANSFTVTWTSNATSTAGPGGGSAVTIQPAFPTSMIQNQYTAKGGATGFNVMHSNIYNSDPSFQPLKADAGNAGWTMYWDVAASPSEPTGTYQTSILFKEMDLLWRGPDEGYEPRLALGVHSLGYLCGPLWTVPQYITGGGVGGVGTPQHVNTMWTLFGNQGFPATYVGLSIQGNALVGKGIDTVSNHGGVGLDLFGSYSLLTAQNPFTTATGTSTITVKTVPTAAGPGQLRKQVNGNTVYIPNVYTISGVTFGGGNYVMSNVNDVAGSFTITGTGTAAATVSGGGVRVVIYFTNLSPYAGMQLSGLWEDGIRSDALSRFTSGLIVHTQPGVGIGWDDGTGTASIRGTAGAAGNVGVTINTAGTGSVIFGTLPVNAANDAGAATANVPVGGIYRNGSALQVRVA